MSSLLKIASGDRARTRSRVHTYNTRYYLLIDVLRNRLHLSDTKHTLVIYSKIVNKLPMGVKTPDYITFKQTISVFLTKHPFHNLSEYMDGKWTISDF